MMSSQEVEKLLADCKEYIYYHKDGTVTLDGVFTKKQLQAIALVMDIETL